MEAAKHGGTEREIRMVLVGRFGSGKSEIGNTILGKQAFQPILDFSSEKEKCKKETAEVDGRILAVVDTPGLYDHIESSEEVTTEIASCISLMAPGPHAFLVVIKAGRFTEADLNALKLIQEAFGEKAADYTMVVFTHGDVLKKKGISVEKSMQKNPVLHDFINQCGGGYIVFNNEEQGLSQVRELLKKIDVMVTKNKESYYRVAGGKPGGATGLLLKSVNTTVNICSIL